MEFRQEFIVFGKLYKIYEDEKLKIKVSFEDYTYTKIFVQVYSNGIEFFGINNILINPKYVYGSGKYLGLQVPKGCYIAKKLKIKIIQSLQWFLDECDDLKVFIKYPFRKEVILKQDKFIKQTLEVCYANHELDKNRVIFQTFNKIYNKSLKKEVMSYFKQYELRPYELDGKKYLFEELHYTIYDHTAEEVANKIFKNQTLKELWFDD